jgi:hypothetical protein
MLAVAEVPVASSASFARLGTAATKVSISATAALTDVGSGFTGCSTGEARRARDPSRLYVFRLAAPMTAPSRRRLLRAGSSDGGRGLFLVAALTIELAWLVMIGYALYHFLA